MLAVNSCPVQLRPAVTPVTTRSDLNVLALGKARRVPMHSGGYNSGYLFAE